MDDDNGNDDFIGSVETTIGALMGAKNMTSVLDIKKEGKNMGKLIVRCEKQSDSNSNVFGYVRFSENEIQGTKTHEHRLILRFLGQERSLFEIPQTQRRQHLY